MSLPIMVIQIETAGEIITIRCDTPMSAQSVAEVIKDVVAYKVYDQWRYVQTEDGSEISDNNIAVVEKR